VSGCSVSPAILEHRGGSRIIVVVVMVVTLDAILDITDVSSSDGDKPPLPGTNTVTADDDDDDGDGVGAPTRDDNTSQNREPWDCMSDGVLDSCTMTIDVMVFALSVATLHAGVEAGMAP